MGNQNKRKVIGYIAASLDGYIAKPNDDLSFLERVQASGEDYGYAAFMQSVDTVLVGRKTYDWVQNAVNTYPHADKQCFVFSRSQPSGQTIEDHVTFYSGSAVELIQTLQQETGKNIYCEGGASLMHALLEADLMDELILSVIPVLLGSGTRMFAEAMQERNLTLKDSKAYRSGLVQVHYSIITDVPE